MSLKFRVKEKLDPVINFISSYFHGSQYEEYFGDTLAR